MQLISQHPMLKLDVFVLWTAFFSCAWIKDLPPWGAWLVLLFGPVFIFLTAKCDSKEQSRSIKWKWTSDPNWLVKDWDHFFPPHIHSNFIIDDKIINGHNIVRSNIETYHRPPYHLLLYASQWNWLRLWQLSLNYVSNYIFISRSVYGSTYSLKKYYINTCNPLYRFWCGVLAWV
jgi:hypothetical protein